MPNRECLAFMKRQPAPVQKASGRDGDNWRNLGGMLVIALAVFAFYIPVLHAGFVWDDQQLITANPLLRDLSGLREIWSGSRTPDYFPLTNTVFWVEMHLFGQNAAGYHVVNVLLQAVNGVLVWKVLQRLQIPGAFLAGLIFAIHPVHVESVAWISELKNVLSMFFYLVSVLCFFEAQEPKTFPRSAAYMCSLVSFILGLLSKTQIVFLPVALLVCIWYQSTRSAGAEIKSSKPSRNQAGAAWRRQVMLILPYFAVALAFGLITIWFQNRGIGEEEIVLGSPARRLVNAAMAIWWYAKQIFVPYPLMAVYPPWRFDSPRFMEWLPLITLIVFLVFLWLQRNRGTASFLFALAYFVVALLPVIGLVRMAYARSGTLVADHLQYFADISLIALVSAFIVRFLNSPRRLINLSSAAMVVLVLGAMGVYSFARATVYRDEEILWHDTLSKNPDAWQGHNRLGQLYFDQKRFYEAARHFERAAVLKPELAENHNLLGLAYCRLERFEEGIAEYHKALQLKEQNPATTNTLSTATFRANLANALTITANNLSERPEADESARKEAMDRYNEAVSEYEKALEIQPDQPGIHRNLGLLLARLGRTSEAVIHLRKVLEYVPNEPIAREMLDSLGYRDR